jgi:transposase
LAIGGPDTLKAAGRAGRKPKLTDLDKQRIVKGLLEGPEQLGYATPLWTCDRVVHLIHEQSGIVYHPGHVWKILRQLNWSPQRPVGRALERDEESIAEWKRKTWPAIKKKPVQKGARSSSSTKAD